MSKIKKYNDSNQNWRDYSSTHANGIYTEVPNLLKDEEDIISVETGLERLSEDVKILKGNVAWLAKNGGGGSGSGGSGSSEATAKIQVNGKDSGETVILDDNGLNITFKIGGSFTKSWNVTISLGVSRIYTGSVSINNNQIVLTRSSISKYLINYRGTLTISASYFDDLNGTYGSAIWNGNIIESSVYLYVQDSSVSLQEIESAIIAVDYAVGVLGDISAPNYQLLINVSKDSQLINSYTQDLLIQDNIKRSNSVRVSDLIPVSSREIGVYNLTFTLRNKENTNIYSTFSSTFTISSSNEIFISSKTLSEDYDNPTSVAVNGSLFISFIAYLQNYSIFNYKIKVNDEIISEGIGEFTKQTEIILSLVDKDWIIENMTTPIILEVSGGGLTAEKTYYIKAILSDQSFLETPFENNLMYQFKANTKNNGQYDISFANNTFNYNNNFYNLNVDYSRINKNTLSVINRTSDGTPYLRISNGSAYSIDKWNFENNSFSFNNFFPSDVKYKDFTISLCFKADYHADDFRTILFCGTIDNTTQKISTGISIDVHDIYVNNKSVYKLTDNIINMVDITAETYEEETLDGNNNPVTVYSYIIKVYVDGVITYTQKLNDFLNFGDKIYLGCQYHQFEGENIYTQFCDCDIYNLRVYNIALTPYEIMINRANNLAVTNYLNDQPRYELIDQELLYNFCRRDNNETDDGINSLLYNKISKDYNINFLFSNNSLNQESLAAVAQNIGIPIMYINVSSNSNWTFNNFANQQSNKNISLSAAENVVIQYWDPGKTNQSILTLNRCTVELQGTSTLEDYVKNLNITVPENTIFIPKDTWLPERTYTLKADVVDSSHSNNAAIGTFINEELGSYLPIDEKAIDNVRNSNYVKNQQPNATLKHTVEGFPIFLIMSFNVRSGSDDVGITPLGIYSFNLGRDAIRNLGFTKINSITDQNEQLIEINQYPFVAENVTVNTTNDSQANWIETRDTNSVEGLKNINSTNLPDNLDTHKGDFWQNETNILNNLFEVRYPNDKLPSQYDNFKNFVLYIMKLPIESASITDIKGQVFRTDVSGSYDLYQCNVEGTEYINTGVKQNISTNYNEFAGGDDVPFNIESYRKYFVIAMLLGLVDNFGKNMAHKSWNGGQYFSGFYDLDSALGGSNQGELNISYTLWIKYLYNKHGLDEELAYAAESYDENIDENLNSVVAASSNKLWLSLDSDVNRSVQGSLVKSLYTQSWYDLRILLDQIASSHSYASFVDYFMDKYYISQTKNCGSLLFNYDYKLKYFLQFNDNSYKETKALSKLHGRKIAYTRNWLEKRILFLDSLFYWRDTAQTIQFRNDTNNRGTNTVRITPKVFPLMFNTSLLVYNSIGNQVTSYYFAKENEKLLVDSANSNSNSILNWNISNSSNLIEFGDSDNKLSDMNVVLLSHQPNNLNVNYIGYPSITTLDLSGTKTLGDFNLSSFAPNPSSSSQTYKRRPISEIRVLDFSNTSGNSTFSLNLVENTQGGTITRFQKLQEIDITGSTCISDLTIPDIPLQKLNVQGSSIRNFILENQAYLEQVSLEGCSRLQTIRINNCDGYRNFEIQNLSNLTTCQILNCSSIENITITNCSILNTINIEACPNLRSITIVNCKSLTGNLTISECLSLESLSLNQCSNLTNFIITNSNVENITTLNVAKTKLQYIREGQYENQNLLDLSNFRSLQNFNISSNEEIKEIQFANVNENPIRLTNTFSSCSNLERVYGNISLERNSLFKELKKFSILGRGTSTFLGYNISSNGITQLPRDLVGNENYFQTGTKVTNIVVNTSDLTSCFEGTNCTLFDIYYLFEKAGNKITNATSIFKDLISDPFSWTDSPHRRMFEKNTNLTNLSNAFFSSGSNAIRLYSPTKTNDEFDNNGLFSYFVKNQKINLSAIFYGRSLYIDRNLFRTNDDLNKIIFDSFSYFDVKLIVDDINQFSNNIDITRGYIAQNKDNLGNLTDFFKQIQSMNSCYSFISSTIIINYDTLKDIPITSIAASFICSYGYGTLDINTLFRNKQNVTNISSSFRVLHTLQIDSNNLLQVNFYITNNTLKGFTSLKYLGNIYSGYTNTGGIATNSYTASSFGGYGYNKYITDMPYKLLDDCSSLILFNGFFRECKYINQLEVTALPGDLFLNTPNLEICSGTFSNINFNYEIQGNCFRNCSKLKDVSYIFSYDKSKEKNYEVSNTLTPTEDVKVHCVGSIPNKLFYHGKAFTNTKTIRGIRGTISQSSGTDSSSGLSYIQYDITSENGSTYWYRVYEDGTNAWENSSNHYQEESITYDVYNQNIENMQGCFYHNNFEQYLNEHPSIEPNPDYMPFDWEFKDDQWYSVVRDDYREMIYWEYDGVNVLQDYKNLDNSSFPSFMYNIKENSTNGTSNYICSPDLLRYCKNTCNVTYLFANCGHDSQSIEYGDNYTRDFKTGIKGRIVPYLLLPLKNCQNVNLDYMFYNCKLISSYQKENRTYLIPEDFFIYCNNVQSMQYTFAGLVFARTIDLNVFNNNITPIKLSNISHIFFRTYYAQATSQSANISSVFNSFKYLTNISMAFANASSINSQDVRQTNIRVQFSNIFPQNIYTKESYQYNSNFKEVFAYFTGSNLVIHEDPKTLPDNSTTNNYTYHN